MSNNCKIICSRFNEDIHWIIPFIENSIIYNKGEKNVDYISKDKIISCSNVGREGGTYLKYIIDNYPVYPDYMIFLQGNPFEHIYSGNKPKCIKEIDSCLKKKDKPSFLYLSKHFIKIKNKEIVNYCSGIPCLHNDFFKCKASVKSIIKKIKQMDQNIEELELLKEKLEKMEKQDFVEFNIYDFVILLKENNYFFQNKNGEKQRDELLLCFNDPIMEKITKFDYEFGYGAQFMIHKSKILRYPLSYWEKLSTGFNVISPSAGWGLEKMWNLILNDYYFRVEWTINVPILACPPFEYIWKNNLFSHNASQNILYFSKTPNRILFNLKNTYQNLYVFLLDNPLNKIIDINLQVGFFKDNLNLFMKFHNPLMIGLIYINYSKNINLFNILNTILMKSHTFILVIENFIDYPGFYNDNQPLAYLYSLKKSYNIELLGFFQKCVLLHFS